MSTFTFDDWVCFPDNPNIFLLGEKIDFRTFNTMKYFYIVVVEDLNTSTSTGPLGNCVHQMVFLVTGMPFTLTGVCTAEILERRSQCALATESIIRHLMDKWCLACSVMPLTVTHVHQAESSCTGSWWLMVSSDCWRINGFSFSDYKPFISLKSLFLLLSLKTCFSCSFNRVCYTRSYTLIHF